MLVSIPDRYAKNGLIAFTFLCFSVVSIPDRYAKNEVGHHYILMDMAVSIPDRYAKNGVQRHLPMCRCSMFQFLIGTLKTLIFLTAW